MLLTLAVIGIVLSLVLFTRHKRRVVNKELPSALGERRELSEEERCTKEAVQVREHWNQEVEAANLAHEEWAQPIREKIDKARELVSQIAVDAAACDILSLMWSWPTYSKRPQRDWQPPFPLEGFDGGGGLRDAKWLAWRWQGVGFRLQLDEQTPYGEGGDSFYGDIRVWANDKLVMQIDVSRRYTAEIDTWRPFDISAFQAGPWMALLNDFAGKLRFYNEQLLRDLGSKRISDKANNIRLDE